MVLTIEILGLSDMHACYSTLYTHVFEELMKESHLQHQIKKSALQLGIVKSYAQVRAHDSNWQVN